MAKKATSKSRSGTKKTAPKSRAVAQRPRDNEGRGTAGEAGFGEAFIKLLQSPLVAELVAVAATAALASLAEHGFTSSNGSRGRRAGKAVKEAGKSAAAAIGRRLSNEIDEIKKAAEESRQRAKA